MADDLMIKFTWAGQVKNGSEKNPENSLAKSKLASTVCGKNTYSLYGYLTREYLLFFVEAVMHGDYAVVNLVRIMEISGDYVRRASDRLRSKLRKKTS